MKLEQVYAIEIEEAKHLDHILAIVECVKYDEKMGRLSTVETMTLLMMIERDKRVPVTGYARTPDKFQPR